MNHVEEIPILRARIAALEEILAVHERTSLDVTQRLEIERARLEEIFESVPAAVLILNAPEWEIAYANSMARSVLNRGDLTGRKLTQIAPEAEAQGYLAVLDQVFQTGAPVRADEARVILDNDEGGEERFYNYTFVPLRDPSGGVGAILTHSTDVTELTTARRQLEDLVGDLRRASELSIAVNAELTTDGVIRVAAKGASEILEATRCVIELGETDDPLPDAIASREPDGLHYIVEHLTAHERKLLGTMLIERPHAFDSAERAVAKQIARFTTVAIERARVYEREHQMVEILQRSLLPERLPDIPGVTVATRYRPGGLGEEVGGDWYDVIALPDGRVGFVLGDVGGKGVRAASIMGQIRTAVRAYALSEHGPADVLSMTDRLLQGMDPDHMVTLVYMSLDMTSGVARVATAGHPPPVVHAPGQDPALFELRPAPPLGIIPHAQFHEHEIKLPDGAVVILYSDGLVERREESLDVGLKRLCDATKSAPQNVEALCDHLLASMLPAPLTDDVAILAFHAEVLSSRPLETEFISSPMEMPRARALMNRWLHSVGVDDDEAFDIILASGEACANAFEHAYPGIDGTVLLRMSVEDGVAYVSVTDRGSWRPPRNEQWRGRGLEIMRSMMDKVEVRRTESGTAVHMQRRVRTKVMRAGT